MDVNRLSRGEQIAGAAAVLLFIDTFLHWYSANVSGAIARLASRAGVDTAVDAWTAFSTTDLLMLLAIIVVLAMVGLTALGRTVNLPVSLPLVAAALAALTTLIVLWRIVNQPGPNDFINVEYGAYFGLLLLIAMTYGAIQAGGGMDTMRAEAESLQDRGTAASGPSSSAPAGAPSVTEPAAPPPTAVADPAPPPQPPTPSPTPPAPDPSPPAPAPDPQPSPAPEPSPPQPGDDPAGPTAVYDEDEPATPGVA